MVSNAFWSFALPQGFERIFKQITHIGVSITLKLQDWVFTRMHCIITFHNVNKVYKTLVFYLLITFRFFFRTPCIQNLNHWTFWFLYIITIDVEYGKWEFSPPPSSFSAKNILLTFRSLLAGAEFFGKCTVSKQCLSTEMCYQRENLSRHFIYI